ncbi:TonB-dependent receptor [Sphingosinicella sp.]|uniref:TonB-dependent receptor n=1 Tax=Sphingosinicella sp. TaxID=1917971 RepID=UPI0035B02389
MLVTCALGAMVSAEASWAQSSSQAESAEAGDARLESEIVVTAQKREQRLLDVPLAVTAVSADTLVEQNLVGIADYYDRVPGLQIGGDEDISEVSIRGITTGGGTNPTIAVLVDDIQFGSSVYAGQAPFPDLDPATLSRIEVLRGPQGTLYGASSLGGLIKFVTRDPSTTRFSGRVEVGASAVKDGDWGYSTRGGLNIPLVDGIAGLSVSGFYRNDPRFIDNVHPNAPGEDVNKLEAWGGRVALMLQPTSNLAIKLSYLRQDKKSRFNDTIQVCPECVIDRSTVTNYTPRFGDRTIRQVPNDNHNRFQLYSGRVELDLGFADLTSITAYGKSRGLNNNDVTAVFGGLFQSLYGLPAGSATVVIGDNNKTNKFSQEIRLGATGETLDWLVGGFYTKEKSDVAQTLFLSGGGLSDVVPFSGTNPSRFEEKSVFGTLTLHATEKLDIQVGGRYADNKQRYFSIQEIDGPAQAVFGLPGTSATIRAGEDAFTWLISPSYHFNPDMMAYARVASGYRPGGPNTDVPTIPTSFDSDSVMNYEVGFKGSTLDRMLSFDIAAFQIDWKDIQLINTDAVSQFLFFTNGGKARSRGVELAGQLNPSEGLSINASTTFTDAKLREDLPPSTAATTQLEGAKGDRLPYSAKFTATLGVRQEFDLSDKVSAYVGGSLAHVGKRFSAFRTDSVSAPRPRYTIPAYTQFDLNAGITYDEVWKLNVFVRNLFDKDGVVISQNRNGTADPTAQFLDPRTIGFTLAREF